MVSAMNIVLNHSPHDVRGVLLAIPGDHGHPRHQADAGGPLGPDHEGHGEELMNGNMTMFCMNVFSFQSMKPFWTISQMSTLDGSPKLERQVRSSVNINHKNDTILIHQVQKFSLQASQKTAGMKASGYFHLSRNMVTRVSSKNSFGSIKDM